VEDADASINSALDLRDVMKWKC